MAAPTRVSLAAVALVVAGCFHEPATAGGAAGQSSAAPSYALTISDPLGFLPIDSEAVIDLDLTRLRATPLWKRFETLIAGTLDAKAEAFQAACGFNPFYTIRRLTAGVRQLDDAEGVVVVQGIDRVRMLACVGHAYPGRHVVVEGEVVTMSGADDKTAKAMIEVMTFADAETLVMIMGPHATKAELQATLAGGAPLRRSPTFLDLFQRIDLADPIWMVMNGKNKLFEKATMLGARPRALLASVDLAAGVSARVRVRFEGADDASQVVSTLTPQLAPLKSFVEDASLVTEGADAVFKLAMTEQQLDAMIGMASGAMGAP